MTLIGTTFRFNYVAPKKVTRAPFTVSIYTLFNVFFAFQLLAIARARKAGELFTTFDAD